MLSGTISNFHDANGMEMSEFVVNLDAATMTNGAVAATAGTTSGHAKGVDWTGNWAGQLGGAPDANVEGLALDSTTAGTLLANIKDLSAAGVTTSYDDFPTGATGTFDAQKCHQWCHRRIRRAPAAETERIRQLNESRIVRLHGAAFGPPFFVSSMTDGVEVRVHYPS